MRVLSKPGAWIVGVSCVFLLMNCSTRRSSVGPQRQHFCNDRLERVQIQLEAATMCLFEHECRRIAIGKLETLARECPKLDEDVRVVVETQKSILRELAAKKKKLARERLTGTTSWDRETCDETLQLLAGALFRDPFDDETLSMRHLVSFNCHRSTLRDLLTAGSAMDVWRTRHVTALRLGRAPLDTPLLSLEDSKEAQ